VVNVVDEAKVAKPIEKKGYAEPALEDRIEMTATSELK
jgi:hypothetical protein